MSLINQMLQDLDAQEGSERQPVITEVATAVVKGRSMWRAGLFGMLLAAGLGAWVAWALGQPTSASPEAGLIPLALPELPLAGKRTENNRPSAVALRAAPTDSPKPTVPEGIPVNPKSKAADPGDRSVEAAAEATLEPLRNSPEPPNIRLLSAAEGKPLLSEDPARPTGAKPSPPQRVANVSSVAGEKKSGEGKPEKRQFVKAITKPYRVFGKENPASDSFRNARFYIGQGRLADAEEALKRTLRAKPGMGQAREILAALLLRGGRQSEAATLLDQGLQLAPGQPVFLSLRARLYREQGDTGQAIALLQQGLRDDGDNGDLLELLGVLYQEEGRFNEAAAVYRRVLQQRPGSANSWAGLAISLDAAGEQTVALQAYRRALANDQLPKEVVEYVRQRVSLLESQ